MDPLDRYEVLVFFGYGYNAARNSIMAILQAKEMKIIPLDACLFKN